MKRLPKDDSISHNDFLISLVSCSNMKTMFPNISILAENILLLPIGSASVERSFSTQNRILNSERCRLTCGHVNDLMKLSIKGPIIPEIKTTTEIKNTEESKLFNLIDVAYNEWCKTPRRLKT